MKNYNKRAVLYFIFISLISAMYFYFFISFNGIELARNNIGVGLATGFAYLVMAGAYFTGEVIYIEEKTKANKEGDE